jgi:hypothetical protein
VQTAQARQRPIGINASRCMGPSDAGFLAGGGGVVSKMQQLDGDLPDGARVAPPHAAYLIRIGMIRPGRRWEHPPGNAGLPTPGPPRLARVLPQPVLALASGAASGSSRQMHQQLPLPWPGRRTVSEVQRNYYLHARSSGPDVLGGKRVICLVCEGTGRV